jgi:hypothetical protein
MTMTYEGRSNLSPDIFRRLAQITFNGPLLKEIEELAIMKDLAKGQALFSSGFTRGLPQLRLHRIAAEDAFTDLEQTSALSLDRSLLLRLRDAGRCRREVARKPRFMGRRAARATWKLLHIRLHGPLKPVRQKLGGHHNRRSDRMVLIHLLMPKGRSVAQLHPPTSDCHAVRRLATRSGRTKGVDIVGVTTAVPNAAGKGVRDLPVTLDRCSDEQG